MEAAHAISTPLFPSAAVTSAAGTAKERARRTLDRSPVHPLALPPSNPVRLLHELLEGDFLEAEELREELAESRSAEESAEEEADDLRREVEDQGEFIARVVKSLGLLDGTSKKAVLQRIESLRGAAEKGGEQCT